MLSVNWSSVGVCPGAQAAKAKRAREETPLFVNALTSSTVRETSAALLLRALVDSRDVLMLLNRQRLRIKRSIMQNKLHKHCDYHAVKQKARLTF